MDPYKIERQNSAIRKTLGELITAEVKDPRIGFVSINEVRLNRDQTVAKVFFSVLGEDDERRLSFLGLKKARGFLQGRLGDVLRLRRTPELQFVLDDAIARGLGIDAILSDLAEQGEFEDEGTRNRKRDLASLTPPHDLIEALNTARSVWIVPHWNPDPDAMGSALALAQALTAMGKEARAVVFPDPPAGFAALPGFEDALPSAVAIEELAASPVDTLIMVDCHEIARAEELAPVLSEIPNAWCIDHHLIEDERLSLPGWIDPIASSASILVLRVIETLTASDNPGCNTFVLDRQMATNLYAGLVTDTGGFRFPNTLPLAFEAAHLLAGTGIDVADIAERVLHRRTREGVELLKLVMETFTFHAGGKIVSLCADQGMLKATGARMSDSEGFVNIATGIHGVVFAMFLKERPDGQWRVSLRATEGGDVQSVAATRGGGGHKLAAGVTMTGTAADVVANLLSDLESQLEA